jgi:hypothetical protein
VGHSPWFRTALSSPWSMAWTSAVRDSSYKWR